MFSGQVVYRSNRTEDKSYTRLFGSQHVHKLILYSSDLLRVSLKYTTISLVNQLSTVMQLLCVIKCKFD